MSTLVVFSCDQKYFPLAKGLVLSLKTAGLAQSGIGVAFIDIGCNPQSLKWFSDSGIRVLPLSALMEIEAMRSVSGYHLAQVCRAYLPTLFPDARCFIWLDSDLWVQIGDTIKLLASWAIANHERLFICPEWHYSYETFNNDVLKFHVRTSGRITLPLTGRTSRPRCPFAHFSIRGCSQWPRKIHYGAYGQQT